eukprot:Skav218216  [mRNA]  locus=scaffold1375:83241:84182:- [translate_table: standard]
MKSFLALTVAPLVAANCPPSSSWVHASCQVKVTASAPCAQVMAEMKARVEGQSTGLWHDPHNNGTYSEDGGDQKSLDFQRVTGNKKYTDKLRFDFQDLGNQCEISGCSASQVFSVADFSTNYCNLRMLYCNSQDGCHPVKFDFDVKETEVDPSAGAGKNPLDCLKVAKTTSSFMAPAPTQCPPADFDTVQDFDLSKFISKRWYIQQQMAVNYLPASQNRCVYAEYQLRPQLATSILPPGLCRVPAARAQVLLGLRRQRPQPRRGGGGSPQGARQRQDALRQGGRQGSWQVGGGALLPAHRCRWALLGLGLQRG